MSIEETKSSLVMACNTCHKEYPQGTDLCPDDGTTLVPAMADKLIGTTFAERYEILEVIGRGGMSVVYKARQKFMNNLVAIKILHPQLSSDPGNFERFQQEAKAAISIRHKNVIQVFDFGVTNSGQSFLIMEYLEGEPLSDYLDEHGSMEMQRALNVFIQACEGLAQAHKLGIIHRDLKPGNIILSREEGGEGELVKIVDFGIAKMVAPDGTSLQSLTQTGEVFGSPLYMSPEQCQGKPLDARSDIYSLGCVMYETLTGMPPLMGINSFETMNKHVKEQPLSLRGVAPDRAIPELIDACVLKCLRKEPERRHQSMNDLKKAIVESAQKSRIYLRQTEGYVPKSFTGDTGSFSPVPEAEAEKKPEAGGPSKELQQLVLDAVSLTNKQEAKNKQLRTTVILLYALLGVIVTAVTVILTLPGPEYEPAPLYKKIGFWWDYKKGDEAIDAGDYLAAADYYKQAADEAKMLGASSDKRLHALLQELTAQQRGKASPEAIRDTKHELLQASIIHMESVYSDSTADLKEVKDLDAGLIDKLGAETLDKEAAENYSKKMVENAKLAFKQGLYFKAISWLDEALDMEKKAHGTGNVTETAEEFARSESPIAREHIGEIEALIKRAREAEERAEKKQEGGKDERTEERR